MHRSVSHDVKKQIIDYLSECPTPVQIWDIIHATNRSEGYIRNALTRLTYDGIVECIKPDPDDHTHPARNDNTRHRNHMLGKTNRYRLAPPTPLIPPPWPFDITTLFDAKALEKAVELADASYQEAMKKCGLVRGTRSTITAHARYHLIQAIATAFTEAVKPHADQAPEPLDTSSEIGSGPDGERRCPTCGAVRRGRKPMEVDEADIVRRYTNGETIKTIAKALGLSDGLIRNRLQKHNVLRERGKPTAVDEDDIVDRYTQGESIQMIATALGVSTDVIDRRLRKNNVEMRKGGKPKAISQTQ